MDLVLVAPLVLVCAAAMLLGAAAIAGALLAVVSDDHRNPCVRWFADWIESHSRPV